MPRILHVSGLGFADSEPPQHDAIRDGLVSLSPSLRPELVCITGDLVGTPSQAAWTRAEAWIRTLLTACSLGDEACFLVPGTRDIDRTVRLKRSNQDPSAALSPSSTLAARRVAKSPERNRLIHVVGPTCV